MKNRFRIFTCLALTLIGFVVIAQTPEQKKMMEEILRKQDSVMNSPQMKEMLQKMENMQESMAIQEKSTTREVKKKEVPINKKNSSNDSWYWENTMASENAKFKEWSGGAADIVMAFKGTDLKTFKIGSINEDGSIIFNLPSSVTTKTSFDRQIGPQGLFFDIYDNTTANYTNKETGFITNVSLLVMRNGKSIGNLTMGNSVKVTKDLTSQSGISSGNEGYIAYWAYSKESCALVLDQDWTGKVRKDGTNTLEVKTNVNYNLQLKPGWNLIKTEVIGKYPLEHERGLDVSWFKNHKHTVVSSLPADAIYYYRSIPMY